MPAGWTEASSTGIAGQMAAHTFSTAEVHTASVRLMTPIIFAAHAAWRLPSGSSQST